jgi:hypothetical protein
VIISLPSISGDWEVWGDAVEPLVAQNTRQSMGNLSLGNIDLQWYFNALHRNDDAEAMKIAANKEILSGVMLLIARREYDLLDRIFRDGKTLEMASVALVTLARSAYTAREYITSWVDFIANIRGELDNRGLNSSRILKGLI